MTAKEGAIKLIEVYVLRGDSLESLKAGKQGHWGADYHASISGYTEVDGNRKNVDSNHIVVRQVEGKDVNEVFSLKAIYDEIQNGNIQQTLPI